MSVGRAESHGLVASGVSAFRGERLVLRDVSLQVRPGGALVLVGANGAGKSTLLRLLAGLARPDAGAVVVDGGVAYLGHQDAIKPGLNVRENLRFPPADPAALDALGLLTLADVPARMLSAGQKRRLALARVVGRGAAVWLLDEPTLGLDAASVVALGTLLARHRAAGGMVVAATHLDLPLPEAAVLDLSAIPPAASWPGLTRLSTEPDPSDVQSEYPSPCHDRSQPDAVDGRINPPQPFHVLPHAEPWAAPPGHDVGGHEGGGVRPFLALLRRELLLSVRHAADTLAALLFFVLAAALFPLAIGPAPETLARLAPGIVWVGALLAALLPLDRLFGADHEDGSLDQLLLSGLPPFAVAAAKAVAHWLGTGLPLLVAAGPVALMLQMPAALVPVLLAGLLPGTAALSLLGTLGAAVVVGARRGGVLLPLLVLPLATPVLIFGAATVEAAASGLGPRPHLLLLCAVLAAALPLCPLAAGGALRVASE